MTNDRFSMVPTMRLLPFLLCGALSVTLPVMAQAAGGKVSLRLSFAGVPVGKLDYSVKIEGDRYTITGEGGTLGVASVASSAKGRATSSGVLTKDGPVPASHDVDWKDGRKKGRLAMRLTGGTVTSLDIAPKRKRRNRVKVTDAHKVGVIDPASAMIVPAPRDASGQTVCTRRLVIFDGVNRYDLTLSPARTVRVKTKGYRGPAHVCRAEYRAIAGHKAGRKSLERLQRATIEMTYAPLSDGVWALHSFKVPTKWGAAAGRARRFKAM